MRNIFNFKRIKTKMLVGFSFIILFVVILGIYNYLATNESNKDTKNMVEEQLPLLIADEKVAFYTAERLAAVRGYLLTGDSQFKDEFNSNTEEAKHYEDIILTKNDSEEIREVIDKTSEWQEIIIHEVFEAYDQGSQELALNILREKAVPLAQELLKDYQEMAESREMLIGEIGERDISQGEITLIIGVVVSVLIAILSLAIAFITSNVITKPIITVMMRMKQIANGDLSEEPLEVTSIDETGQLTIATNTMTNNMRELLNKIHGVSETVTSQSEELTQSANEVMLGTEQVASTMQELASGSESQANNASDLSSSMSDFTKKVQEATINGVHVQTSSKEVLLMTHDGEELMKSSTKQMTKIDQIVHQAVERVENLDTHAQEISELVSVIKDIAEQTNLLALNAAIEAARAGEHGQGFAVVADEVRKLAEQSSDSVTTITGIVDRIQNESSLVVASLQNGYKEVEQGTGQIITTGETFTNISVSVTDMVDRMNNVSQNLTEIEANTQKMNGAVQDIAAISEESAAGVEQTSASTQQTNSAMEEVAASSDELSKLAEELNGLVNQFKL